MLFICFKVQFHGTGHFRGHVTLAGMQPTLAFKDTLKSGLAFLHSHNFPPLIFSAISCLQFLSPPSGPSPLTRSSISLLRSDYLSKLAISWLLYRDDVSPCPRVHQVGFLLLYLVKPKLTAGLVGVLLDLTKGLGLVLMRVNPVWFIAGLSKKINGSPFESKSLIALCTYVSSLWISPLLFCLWLSSLSVSHWLILILPLHHCHVSFYNYSPPFLQSCPVRGSNLPLSMAARWIAG